MEQNASRSSTPEDTVDTLSNAAVIWFDIIT
jgi:hypothetical protein